MSHLRPQHRRRRSTPSSRVAFDCATHGAYAISGAAVARFMVLDAAKQEAALERARVFAPQRNQEIIITALDL